MLAGEFCWRFGVAIYAWRVGNGTVRLDEKEKSVQYPLDVQHCGDSHARSLLALS